MQSIKVKRIKSNAVLPKRATDGAAGADLYACIDQPVTIESGDLVMIPTGIAIELPTKEMAGFVFARSGLGIKHGICPSNAVGVIDSDYRGEICVGLTNHGKEPFIIEPQMRIAQLIVIPVIPFETEETEELGATMRGGSGFGSTGL